MNEDKKIKKLNLSCSICGAKVCLTPEELKAGKNVGKYIVRHSQDSTMVVVQMGTVCDKCLAKTIEQRVVYKR